MLAGMNPTLVEALRGTAVESSHRGAVAVLDADGKVVTRFGDIERPIFPRSAVKLLQALPLVESGAADRLALTDAELALACASHNGEDTHADLAAAMLAKAGVDEQVLECGAHWPMHDATAHALAARRRSPCALHNNCSGKHAGFVCLASALGGPGLDLQQYVKGYVQPGHAVMREVTAAIEAATGCDLADAPMGIDGCSIPTYALPLRQLALAFARAGTGAHLRPGQARAAARLRQAVAREPFSVAGTDRFDTRVMRHFGERVFCKVGAEGVYCASLPEQGLGVAIKMDDGNTARAAEVVMASVIAALAVRDDADARFIDPFVTVTLRNWNGLHVGTLRPAPSLHRPPR